MRGVQVTQEALTISASSGDKVMEMPKDLWATRDAVIDYAHRNAPYQPAAPVHMGADRVEPARADRRNHADRAPHHRRSRRAIVRRGVAAAGFAALGSLWTAGFQPAWGAGKNRRHG
jgi:hypothetical protein